MTTTLVASGIVPPIRDMITLLTGAVTDGKYVITFDGARLPADHGASVIANQLLAPFVDGRYQAAESDIPEGIAHVAWLLHMHPGSTFGHYHGDKGRKRTTPRTKTQFTVQRSGLTGRLNGVAHGYAFDAIGDLNAWWPAKKRVVGPPVEVSVYRSVTIEADKWLGGVEFAKGGEGLAATHRANAAVRRLLCMAGLEGLVSCITASGGKSIHMHLSCVGTSDRATHMVLVAAIRRVVQATYAAHGVALDTSVTNPSQLVRLPIGDFFGRNQECFFIAEKLSVTHEQAIAALHDAELNNPEFKLELVGFAEEGLRRLGESPTALSLVNTLMAVVAGNPAQPSKQDRAIARERRITTNNVDKGVRWQRDGKGIQDTPIDGALLTREHSGAPLTVDSVALEDFRATLEGTQLSRTSYVWPAEVVDAGDRASAYIFKDHKRHHIMMNDKTSETMTPLITPVGMPALSGSPLVAGLTEFDVKTYDASPNPGVNFIFATPGIGKTTLVRTMLLKRLAADPNTRGVIVCPTKALTAQTINDLTAAGITAVHYSDTWHKGYYGHPRAISPGTVVITTFHSLHHFNTDSVDFAVVDEFGGAVTTLGAGKWEGTSNERGAWVALVALLKHAKETHIFEAVATASNVYAMDALVKSVGCAALHVGGEKFGVGRDAVARDVIIIDAAFATADILARARGGTRCLVQVASMEKAEQYAKLLRREGKTLLVTSLSMKANPEIAKLLGDNGAKLRAAGYQHVVATTTLSAGVSFIDCFDANYVFINGVTDAQSVCQAASRDRVTRLVVLVQMSIHWQKKDAPAPPALQGADDVDRVIAAVALDRHTKRFARHNAVRYLRSAGFNIVEGEAYFDTAPVSLDAALRFSPATAVVRRAPRKGVNDTNLSDRDALVRFMRTTGGQAETQAASAHKTKTKKVDSSRSNRAPAGSAAERTVIETAYGIDFEMLTKLVVRLRPWATLNLNAEGAELVVAHISTARVEAGNEAIRRYDRCADKDLAAALQRVACSTGALPLADFLSAALEVKAMVRKRGAKQFVTMLPSDILAAAALVLKASPDAPALCLAADTEAVEWKLTREADGVLTRAKAKTKAMFIPTTGRRQSVSMLPGHIDTVIYEKAGQVRIQGWDVKAQEHFTVAMECATVEEGRGIFMQFPQRYKRGYPAL